MGSKLHLPDLIPTAGGTLLSTWAGPGLVDMAGTVILAFVGALVSYLSTQGFKWLHKRITKP